MKLFWQIGMTLSAPEYSLVCIPKQDAAKFNAAGTKNIQAQWNHQRIY